MPKIRAVRTWTVDLGNTKPYTIAFKTIDAVFNAFLEVTLDNGITGLGAGNPSEYVTGESMSTTRALLTEANLTFLIGRDILSLRQLTFEAYQKFHKTPATLAAIDIALHDAFAKSLGIPLVDYLGRKFTSLPTSNTIGIKDVTETLKEAEEYGNRGFTILKVKLGKDLEEDIERLVKLRERFKTKFTLRIDANQGYTFEQTIEFFKRTKSLDLELVEQPLPAKAVDQLKRLPEELRDRIAADESLLSASDALTLLAPPRAVGIFNIKLMKCGGVSQALRIADLAETAAVDLFWGCNDESIVSITAALHAAFACANTRYIDLDGSLDLANDVVTGGFILKDGVMRCSEEAGLGVYL